MSEIKINKEKILKYSSLALLGVALLLAFIGCFGNVTFGGNGASVPVINLLSRYTYSFTYFFSDIWKYLSDCTGQPEYGVMLFQTIIHFLSYIVCVGGVIYLIVTTLIKFIKKSDDVCIPCTTKKLFLVVTPYITITALIMYFRLTQIADGQWLSFLITYGWGCILFIVAGFIAIVASCLSKIKSGMNKNDIVSLVLHTVTELLIMFTVVFSFMKAVDIVSNPSFPSEVPFSFKGGMCIFDIVYMYFGSDPGILDPSIGAFSLTAMILSLLQIGLLMVAFKTKNFKVKVISLATVIAFAIISGVFANKALGSIFSAEITTLPFISAFGTGPIVQIVLITISLIAVIVEQKFKPEK